MDIGDWATAYAAIVATAVGGVQIWQFLRSGARLRIKVAPSMSVVGGHALDQDMIMVTVTNIGTAPTTIEGLYIVPKKRRFFMKSKEEDLSYYIPNPHIAGSTPNIPMAIGPGEKWTGFIRLRKDSPNFRNGNFLACIGSTMHRKDLVAPIPKKTS